MKRGDAYNPTYPGFFLERIRQEGMFDNLADTKYREEIDETSKTVNVMLEFLGRKREEAFPRHEDRGSVLSRPRVAPVG